MSRRCYIMLYKKLKNSKISLLVPIKSEKIGSAYGGMPQFFGGGALPEEDHLKTIKRELYEEGYNRIQLNTSAEIDLIYSSSLKMGSSKINFSFYISCDFKHDFEKFPFIASKDNDEISIINELILSKNLDIDTYTMCEKFNIIPSDHFQKSETFKAIGIMLRKLTKIQ